MKRKGIPEYIKLMHSMQDLEIPCTDDDRFIMDDSDESILQQLCDQCPVFVQCRKYALAAQPEGGVWAGLRFKTTTSKEKN